jgi:riboflavin synthase
MFSGIIEAIGKLEDTIAEGTNLHLWFSCPFTQELKVDQSLSHNGCCLTVVEITENAYKVTAIKETLTKTNLKNVKKGDFVNLERCVLAGGRFDGHIVQGHVDQTGICEEIKEENGSWIFTFSYDQTPGNLTVEKGSICVNGVSLTVVNSSNGKFSVCVIPYTFAHTNFSNLKKGDLVNLEFDILGKYINAIMEKRGK